MPNALVARLRSWLESPPPPVVKVRASASNNAGFPDASGPSSLSPAFGVGLDPSRLKSGVGPVRGLPPVSYKASGKNVRLLGFEQHPVVMACMRVITDTVCSVPLKVYRKQGDTEVELPNHPLQKLLDKPSLSGSARQLRSSFALDFITYGNAFWRLLRNTPLGPPVAIRRLNPEAVQVVYVDGDENIIEWMWIDHFGRVHHTGPEDIIHFRDLQLAPVWMPPIFGYPRVATALNSIAGDSEATKYVRQIVTNDGTPTLAFIMADDVSQGDAETAQERWHQLNVERGRRGRAAFVGGVKDVKAIGFNLRNLEFPELRQVNREDICATLGVDPRMIGIASATSDGGLSGQQYVEARKRLNSLTIEPLLTHEEDSLESWLSPEFGDVHVGYDREVLQELAEDDQATSTRVRGEYVDGLRTREESREALHLSPDMKPTDSLWLANTGQMVPVAVSVMDPTPEPPDPTAAPTAAKPVEPVAKSRSDQRLQERLARGCRVIERGVKLSAGQRQLLWAAFDQRATREETEYKRTALRLFDEERTAVGKVFAKEKAQADTHRAEPHEDQYVAAALRKVKQGYRPGGEYHQRWLDSYRSLVSKTYTVAGQDLAETLGFDFELSNPAVAKAVQDRLTRLGDFVTDTTARQISAAVTAGRNAGMGIGDIAKLIDQSVFGGMTQSRATMIARTETIGALNQGEYDTATEQGVMRSKEWLTQQDELVRDSHAELDGVRVDLDEAFDNGCAYPGDQAGGADEVINCRCTLLFYDEAA